MHWLVLSAIKVTERFDLAEKMYEAAWAQFKSKPNFNQEDLIWIGQSLFGAYIRSNNSAKQRLHAMSMWKDLKSEQYYFWSIVAMVTPLADSDKMLAIADRMIETWFEQGKIQNQEQVEYYVGVLVKQNKLEEALTILRSEPAKKAFGIPSQLRDREARLLVCLRRFDEARDIYRNLLETVNSDEWSWYLGFFDNLFSAGLPDGDAANSRAEVFSMLSNLQAKTLGDRTKYRGPFLAALEFAKRLSAAGIEKSIPSSLFAQYFEHFGGKSCFFRDIAPYLASLSTAEARKAVLAEIDQNLGSYHSEGDQPSKVEWSYRLASAESVRRSLSAAPSAHAAATSLLKHYQETRLWNLKKETTERMCGDDLALLAAHYALDNRSSASSLFDAAAILEYAIGASKHNFQFRLLLLHVYAALGAAKGCLRQIEELEIKQIQLDTMGHLFLDTLSNEMQPQELLSLTKRTRHFHDDNRKNTNDYILEAYKNNRYSKVKEIGLFQERLESSLQLVVAGVAQVFAQLALETHTLESSRDLLNNFFLSKAFGQVPMTESAVACLRDNSDADVEDCYDLEKVSGKTARWNNDLACSYPCKTSAYRDSWQRDRVLLEIQALHLLHIVAGTPLDTKKMTSESATLFGQSISLVKSLLQKIAASSEFERSSFCLLLQSLELTPLVLQFSSSLGTDESQDFVSGCDELKTQLSSFSELLYSTWATVSDSPISCGLSAPDHFGRLFELSFFMSRVAIPLHTVIALWSRVFPPRMRPKASEQQKAAHTDVRALLRQLLLSLKDIFARYDQLGSKDSQISTELDFQPASLPIFDSLGLSPSEAKKVVDYVKETVTGSIKDSLINFSIVAKEKLKDISSCKF
eukprot:TRINITY_DN139_c0_g1_i2.p1 TRINITY_DN139_c0_g1~~TRINITY_DN139_c0_g1_i2.p1  ORF type:complete len:863 (+),score=119.72 TRINITY_DN139_c0_g1_i2:611-3199(+)